MRRWLQHPDNAPRAAGALLWGVTLLASCRALAAGDTDARGAALVAGSLALQALSPAARAVHGRAHRGMRGAHALCSAALLAAALVFTPSSALLATLLGECAALQAALAALWTPDRAPLLPADVYLREERAGSAAVDL